MRSTIEDIASRLGVSKMTVSRALRGVGGLREGTRQRVLEAAKEMGYRPNSSAKAVRNGRFGSIALLASSVQHRGNVLSGAVEAIQDVLAELDYRLTLARLPDEKLTSEEYVPQILRELSADGILISYIQHIPDRLVQLVRDYRVPAVWMNTKWETDCVHPDDREAAQRATQYLLRLGHRKIAYLDFSHDRNPDNDHYSAFDRFEGYAAAMTQVGLAAQQLGPVAEIPPGQRFEAARQALSQPDRPTAIITYSQAHANFVAMAALEQGLRIPQELSIMSFCDVRSISMMGRPMTAMVLPEPEIGKCAVEMLLKRIERPDRALPARVHPFVLHEGDTTAPPPAR